MSVWLIVGIVILVILIIALFVLTSLLSYGTTHPKRTTMADGWRQETSKPYMKGLDMNPASVYKVIGYDGYELDAAFLPAYDYMDDYGRIDDYNHDSPAMHISDGSFAPEGYNSTDGSKNCNGQRFVIISHGYTYNMHGSLKYASIFRRLGYNCVIYDDRNHGENAKSLTTFGRDESRDLMAVIDDTRRRFGEDIALGCHGESMGTGLTITALQYNPKLDFIIADCGYADLENVIRGAVKNVFHLPGFAAPLGAALSALFFHFNYMKVRPIDHMGDMSIPICFAHGGDDTFIPPDNSIRMHEAYAGYSEYHEYPGAIHAASIDSDYDRYEEMIVKFLDKVYND